MFDINLLLILIPTLPLTACLVTAVLGPRVLRKASHLPTVAAVVLSFLCSLALLSNVSYEQQREAQHVREGSSDAVGYEHTVTLFTWADVRDALVPSPPAGAAAASQESGSASQEAARDFRIEITLRADALTAIMLATVTFVSALIAIYSVGYMHDDRGYWRYFTYFSLFVFSMTMLVSVSNFILLYVFWEAVGLCSYLLIGFWYEKPSAAAAGKKAFLVNRVGDFGFALGLFLLWTTYGTLNFHDASGVPGVLGQTMLKDPTLYVGGGVGLAICLLLLLGACGKSAQFPLHVWLPDAMEGPTPVSALIHAATMVTAGIYLVARCTPLFMVSPEAQLVVACVGGLTALMAGIIALTQTDLKRVLAYSTISQLGYSFLALGTGLVAGVGAGMFHLFTHAFFKALLFLSAGSVMHAMGGVIDMQRFGGLRRRMPITCIVFLCGALALSGIFPLAGFWSKDAVIASVQDKVHRLEAGHDGDHADVGNVAHEASHETPAHSTAPVQDAATLPAVSGELVGGGYLSIYRLLYWAAVVTAFLTTIYTFRAFFMTFFGEERIPQQAGDHAHESPPVMWVPMAVLAVGALVVGWLFYVSNSFFDFLGYTPMLAYSTAAATATEPKFHYDIAALTSTVALLGIGIAAYFYLGRRNEAEWLASVLRFDWFESFFGSQWIPRLRMSRPATAITRVARAVGLGWLAGLLGCVVLFVLLILLMPVLLLYMVSPYRLSKEKFYIDEIYAALVVAPLRAGADVCYWFDRNGIDGLVDLVGNVPRVFGGVLRRLQSGVVPFYALATVLGVLLLIAAKLLLGNG